MTLSPARSGRQHAIPDLRVTVFVPPVPHVVAARLGFLAEAGVSVEVTRTTSSNEQQQQLEAGERDLAVTALDNLIVWNGRGPRIGAVAQVERTTMLHVYARPGIDSLSDLARRRFAVDAATNGFAIVVRHILTQHGIRDVALPEVGGVKERLDALLDGRADATLLGPPFDSIAEGHGLVRLLTVNDVIPAFPGQGLVVRADRAPELRPALVAYLAALNRAVDWSANADALEALPLLHDAGLPDTAATAAWKARPRSLDVSPAGLDLILSMRRDLGLPPTDSPAAETLLVAL